MTHSLKTWPSYFSHVCSGVKTFEVRKDDRNFKVGDVLLLREYDNNTGQYTGNETSRLIVYKLDGGTFGIEPGYCVLGLNCVCPECALERTTMRKLVTIQQIEEVRPIEGADMIVKARIKGWWIVVRKDQFKVGDKCIYFEIDSLLPNIPQFSFLAKGQSLKKSITDDNKEVEGFRLKTVKLRNTMSQGLIMPFSEFPDKPDLASKEIDEDVTSLLGVYKYEMPIPIHMSGETKGVIPAIIPVTDEERVQNCIALLDTYKGYRFYVTSKIDGTSSTIYKYDGEFGVCGHHLEFKENDKTIFWMLARKYDLRNRLPDNYAIQGETAGEGIQSNRLKLKGVDMYVFYVVDLRTRQFLMLDDTLKFVKDLGLKTVPIVNDNFVLNHTCDELLAMANGPSLLNPSQLQEGLVFRLYNNTDKVSFKAISNDYLLKHGL